MIRLAISNKAAKTSESSKPEYLKMTGSIWNAPQANANQKTDPTKDNLNNLNTLKSLNDMNGDPKTNSKDLSSIDNAADGKKAAKDMEGKADDVKSKTADVEKDNKTATKLSGDAQKLDKEIKSSDKSFANRLQKEQAELKQNNAQLAQLVQENETTQKEIEQAQNELDTLLATNSFSINKDGTSTNTNQGKINDLQQLIGCKAKGMQQNGRVIYSLQRNQTRSLNNLNKTNAVFVKTQKRNAKAIEQKETKTQSIVKFATKIEQYSALIAAGGQALNLAGQGLVALGSAMSGFFGVGAALIAAGTVMQKIGTVAEMVGNYGQAAANITKTGAYAAEGNLQAAMQSATAATMTGAAAVKQTQGLKDTFGSINAKADQATQKLAANTAAKEQIEQVQNDAVKDLAKEKGIDTTNMESKDIEKALKKEGVSGKDIKNAKKNAFGVDADGKRISAKQAKNAVSADLQARMDSGEINVNTRNNKFKQAGQLKDQLANNNEAGTSFKNTSATGFKNKAVTNTVKTSTAAFNGDTLKKMGNGLAAVFGQNNNTSGTNNTGKSKGPAPQWDLANNRQFQRIYASNRRNIA